MKMKRIGTYQETTARGDHDSGLKLEAVDAVSSWRFLEVSFAFLTDEQGKGLNRGDAVELDFITEVE
jgi:hypothetical protein